MDLQETLEKETRAWLMKLEKEMEHAQKHSIREKGIRNEMKNVHAYIADCKHFLEQRDMVRAFEAVMYAWGMFDTLARTGFVKSTRFKD